MSASSTARRRLAARSRRHWSFDDPSRATGTEDEQLAVYRRVRDEIRARIEHELLTP